MLKEFFILKETSLFFYYSKSEEHIDFNDVILSSGLLSALNSFTISSRANSIHSFQTESELFKFTSIQEESLDLIFVFDVEEYFEHHSEIIMQNIIDLVKNSKYLQAKKYIDFSSSEYNDLKESISYIVDFRVPNQLTDQNLYQILSKERNIDYCIIRRYPIGDIIAKYSKIITLAVTSFEDEHGLLISIITKGLSNLQLAETFLVINFEGNNQQFLIFNMENYTISFLSSENKSSSYYTEILKNFPFSNNLFQYAKLKLADFTVNSKYIREESGKIVFQQGIKLPTQMNIYLSTLVHNVANFSKISLSKGLLNFSIVYISIKNELSLLKAEMKREKMEITINFDK